VARDMIEHRGFKIAGYDLDSGGDRKSPSPSKRVMLDHSRRARQ
jgi:hypothetical protein